jgi:hypothetical protein
VLSGVAVLLVAVGLVCWLGDGLPERAHMRQVQRQLQDLYADLPRSGGGWCDEAQFAGSYCAFDSAAIPAVVVAGDSHAPRAYLGLRAQFSQHGIPLALFGGANGCPPFVGLDLSIGGVDAACAVKFTGAFAKINDSAEIRTVILVNRGPWYTEGSNFGWGEHPFANVPVLSKPAGAPAGARAADIYAEALRRTLTQLQQAGKRVIYLHNVPELPLDVRTCLRSALFLGAAIEQDCSMDRREYEARNRQHRALVDAVLKDFKQVRSVDLADALCDAQRCYALRDGIALYSDSNHLSERGSQYVMRRLAAELLQDIDN